MVIEWQVTWRWKLCYSCDEALDQLERYGLQVEVVDIDADPVLREQYTECVPVVRIDGVDRFRGRINDVLLQRLLRRSGGMGA